MPLHTDIRPHTLDAVVGNKDTIAALKTHMNKESPNHCILITGQSGCGKSTLAQCIAHMVIGGGEHEYAWNLTTLNSSDDRGIGAIRTVIDVAGRGGLGQSDSRVWIFEEAHKLTPDAKEALLDFLEHCPANAWFIFTTTEADKFNAAFKRRFAEFEVRPLSEREMIGFLVRVVRQLKPKRSISTEILTQIHVNSEGSPGIALKILDSIIDLPEEQMTAAIKRKAEQLSNVVNLCQELLKMSKGKSNQKWPFFAKILKDLENEDDESTRRRIREYFKKILLEGDTSAAPIMLNFGAPCNDSASLSECVFIAWEGFQK
jgi:DNA polymerase III gamma/tau subunit